VRNAASAIARRAHPLGEVIPISPQDLKSARDRAARRLVPHVHFISAFPDGACLVFHPREQCRHDPRI
jgi:hypothetical protein